MQQKIDINNCTPLHYLCSNSSSNYAGIKVVAETNPDLSQLTNSQTAKSKLVVEMLGHLTLDEMRACADAEEGIRAKIDQKKGLQTTSYDF